MWENEWRNYWALIGRTWGFWGEKTISSPNGFVLKFMCDSSQHCFGSPLHHKRIWVWILLAIVIRWGDLLQPPKASASILVHILVNARAIVRSSTHPFTDQHLLDTGWHTSVWWTVSSPVTAATERSSPAHLDFKEHDTAAIFILLSCMFLSLWKCSWPFRVSIGIF